MASPVDICNRALDLLGMNTIVDFDGRSQAARSCEIHYDASRKTSLRDHPWSFAKTIIRLSGVELPDGYKKYAYAYSYPFDALCILSIKQGGMGNAMKYEIARLHDDTKVILTNCERAVATYTGDVVNSEIFDEMFEETLMYKVAAKLAHLSKSRNKEQDMERRYESMLVRARVIDGNEEEPEKDEDDVPWLTARTSNAGVYR